MREQCKEPVERSQKKRRANLLRNVYAGQSSKVEVYRFWYVCPGLSIASYYHGYLEIKSSDLVKNNYIIYSI